MNLPDGIYVGLSFEAYLSDEAFGSHELAEILVNSTQAHAAHRNKEWAEFLDSHKSEREREAASREAYATLFGTACHTVLLEPETFDARYFEEPEAPDWPKTIEQLTEAIRSAGHIPPKGKREVFVETAHAIGLKVAEDWAAEREVLAGGRICLSPRTMATLKLIEATFRRHRSAPKWLTNGLAEVSVFWTDANGLRLKCRFDYLRIRHAGDVKTYRLRQGSTAIDSFIYNLNAFAWDFQAADYMDCRVNAMPDLIAAGKVYDFTQDEDGVWEYAPSVHMDFFIKLAAFAEPSWAWIACATGGYPEVDTIRFPTETVAFMSAEAQVRNARQIATECMEKYAGEAWVSDRPTIVLNDVTLSNARARDRGAVSYDTED